MAEASAAAATGRGASRAPASGPMVWVDGARRELDVPHISARDRGLTLADGLFETMRLVNGRVFRLEQHMARLSGGLAALAIPEPADIAAWLHRAIAGWPHPTASIRLTVTRGVAAGGVGLPSTSHPSVIVTMAPMPQFPAATYERGLSGHVASGRRNERSMTAGLKTLAYVDAVAALIEAGRAGADEAVFLDTEGHVSEASASNVFVVGREALATPPLSCGVLPGVTRAAVLDLAVRSGLSVSEHPLSLEELRRAEEVFLTSSLRGMAPLVRLNGSAVGAGRPGEVTRRLTDAYAALVERETGGDVASGMT